MACIDRYKTFENIDVNPELDGTVLISHSDGRVMKLNSYNQIKLNAGSVILARKYNGNDVLNARDGYIAIFDKQQKNALRIRMVTQDIQTNSTTQDAQNNTNSTTTTSTITIPTIVFSNYIPMNADFSWYLIPKDDLTFYIINLNGSFLGYDQETDLVISVTPDDSRKVAWNITSGNVAKKKMKALSNMMKGQQIINGSLKNTDTCVVPKESLTNLGLADSCFFLDDPGFGLIPTTNGIYPDQGCMVSSTNYNEFKQSLDGMTNAIDRGNALSLKELKNDILKLSAEVSDLMNITIPNETNSYKNARNKLNELLQQCGNYKTRKQELERGIISLQGQNENAYRQYYQDKYPQVKSLIKRGKAMEQQCTKTIRSYQDSKNQLRPNYCMDVSGVSRSPGAIIHGWDCWGGPNQKWKYDSERRIISQNSEMCLDAAGWGSSSGTPIIQWPCHDGGNQKWDIDDQGRIQSALAPDMCIAPTYGYGWNGDSLVLKQCDSSDSQKWSGIRGPIQRFHINDPEKM